MRFRQTVYLYLNVEDQLDAENAVHAALENATEDDALELVEYGALEEVTS